MGVITDIRALEVLDSRGNPTVEVHLCLDNTVRGKAIVPSGASTGTHEALELRDKDPKRYGGKGVTTAIDNIHTSILSSLQNNSYNSIQELDAELLALDGTPNKSNLGANALLGVSMAWCQTMATKQGIPLFKFLGTGTTLPTPLINVLNGGAHAATGLDVQECMLVPVGAASWSEGIRMGAEVFQTLKKILQQAGQNTAVGDEGGFAPDLKNLDEALALMCTAIEQAGYTTQQIKLALDVAATEIYKDGAYHFEREGIIRSGSEMVQRYAGLCEKYPLISIEDGFAEDDFPSWIEGTATLGETCMTVGDDLFVTNIERLQTGINEKQANAILIKLNQIGTVSETLAAIQLAQENNIATIISHRSGETEDTFIADLAVATNAGWIKTGSTCRADRTAKYNQLSRIDAHLRGNLAHI